MDAEHGSRWVDRLVEAFNAHDTAAVGEFMTADIEYRYWMDEAWTSLHDRSSVTKLLDSLDREWSSDFSLEQTFALVTDRGFVIEYVEVGTLDRGPAPTGRRFSLRNVMVGEFRAGRISRMTDYSDVTAYRMQTNAEAEATRAE